MVTFDRKPTGSEVDEGLLFLACCADLRRQIEVVQGQWLQDGARFGLGRERDPIVGNRGTSPAPSDDEGKVSIDVGGRRRRTTMAGYVTMRGGEYFLVPGRDALRLLASAKPDLLIVNGRVPVTNLETDPELVRFYRNRTVEPGKPEGRPGHFFDWTGQVGLKELGPLLGRGSAVADYDNDGDLDVAINQIAGDLVLLTNDAAARAHWLILDPAAVVPGLRAVVTLPDGRMLVREVHAGSSYLAGEDFRLHFGLGVTTVVPQIELLWPDGRRDVLTNVGADQIYSLP